MFDQAETMGLQAYGNGATEAPAWAYEPWLICPPTMWCSAYSDRLSASILNKRIVERGRSGLSFFGGVGVVYDPASTQIWCSFVGDGGTMNPDSAHGCGSDRAWCDPESADNDHQCPWRPQHLNHMLATFEQKPFGYNEVLVATGNWTAKLPKLIEAILWVDGPSEGRSLGSSVAEAQARGVHAAFLRHYPNARPRLLKMDLSGNLDIPFVEVK